MSKLTISAALAATLAAAMPAAFAQTMNPATTPATGTATERSAMPANHVLRGQLRFTDMNGATVYDTHDNNVGDINNIIIDRDGRIAAVLVKTGAFLGIGGKNVALAMNDLKVTTDKNGKPRFTVEMTKDQLKAAQGYNATPPSRTESGSTTPPTEPRRPAEK